MGVLLTSIEVTQVGVSQRKLGQILKEGMRRMAQNHRLVTMGKHFQKNAETTPGGAYGYVPRSARYLARKLARFGTDDPNVRTGRLKRSVRNNSMVTATQDRSRLTIKTPQQGDGRRPLTDQRRSELEAITPAEVKDAQKLGREYVTRESAKPANQLKRKSRLK
jgi:hypothetical protein